MARSIYAAGFLTFGLLVTTSLVPAHADTVKATSAWTVNKVASMAAGSYCTMAQKYSDDTIMTFAKSQRGEYSLAFDFIKPQFPNGDPTTVSLRTGTGATQTFNVTPQSDKVIVIGLGADEKFVTAMKSSGKVDLESNGRSHGFAMDKFASAVDELSNCAGSMKPVPMAGVQAPAAVEPAAGEVAPSVQKVAAVQPTIISNPDVKNVKVLSGASADMAALQAENAELRQALAQSRKAFEAAQNNSQSSMASELQEKLEVAVQENQVLKAQKVSPVTAQELSKAKADLAAALELNQRLQAQTSQVVAQQQSSALAGQQLAQLQQQSAAMKAQLDTANQTVAQLQAQNSQSATSAQQLAQLQRQNADIKVQLDAANANVGALQSKAFEGATSAQQVLILQKQAADMRAQLQTANASLSQVQAKASESTAAAQQLAVMQKQAADMKVQLDTANANIAQMQVKAAEGTNAAQQVATLQKQNADMKVQLEASNSTVTQLQTKLAAMPASNPAIAAENASLRKQIESLQSSVAPATEYKQQVSSLQGENTELKQQLAQLQASGKGAPVVNNTAEVSSLKTENATLKQQLANAQMSKPSVIVNPSSSNQAIKDIQNQLETAQNENTALKNQLDQMATSAGGNTNSTSGNWDLEQATKRYQESQREIRRLGTLLQTQQQKFKKEKSEYEAKLFDPAITSQEQIAKLDQMQQRIDQLESGNPSAAMASNDGNGLTPEISAAAVPVAAVERSSTNVASISPAAGVEGGMGADKAPYVQPKSIIDQKPVVRQTMPVASAVISPAVSVSFQSREDYARMIKGAGINIRGDVETVAGGNTDTYRAYRWKTDSLFGSVEQRAMKSGKGFDEAVNEYLDRAKSRCAGDFAAVPSDVSSSAEKVKSYEIACIGGKANTSASVLFTYGNDVMTTLAHEGKSEAMDLAMEARDRMVSQMGSLKTASK